MHLRVKNDERQMPERRTSGPEHVTLWMGRCGVGRDGHVAHRPGPAQHGQHADAPGWELGTHHHRHHYLFAAVLAAVCVTHYMACRQGKQNWISIPGGWTKNHAYATGRSESQGVPPGYGPHCHCFSDFRWAVFARHCCPTIALNIGKCENIYEKAPESGS